MALAQCCQYSVIPAKAGIQTRAQLDSGLRRNDDGCQAFAQQQRQLNSRKPEEIYLRKLDSSSSVHGFLRSAVTERTSRTAWGSMGWVWFPH